MQPQLSIDEAMLVIDALNGVWIDEPPELMEQLLWMSVEDAIQMDHLDQKWSVDGPPLVEKLKALDHAEAESLVAKIKQFWGEQYHVADSRTRVLEIGMATEEVVTPTEASKLSGKSASALSQLADRGKLVRYQDSQEPNPQRRTRYLKREVLSLKKAARKKGLKNAAKCKTK